MKIKEFSKLKPGTLITVKNIKNLSGVVLEIEHLGIEEADVECLSTAVNGYPGVVNFDKSDRFYEYNEWLRSDYAVCIQPGFDNGTRWHIHRNSMEVLDRAT